MQVIANQTGNLIDNPCLGENRVSAEQFTPGEREFIQHMKLYHNSREKAVNARKLVQFGQERKIRRMIHKLRLLGIPIVSQDTGYFIASNPDDFNECLHRLKGTALQTFEVLAALYIAKEKMKAEVQG